MWGTQKGGYTSSEKKGRGDGKSNGVPAKRKLQKECGIKRESLGRTKVPKSKYKC